MKEVVETINPLKYFDLSHRNSHGYDSVNMLQCVLLAFGYVSLRKLASLCRYDIRFQFIMDGQTPSHMAFHRFIHDDLKMPIEEIFYDLNRYFEKNDTIDADILYIDGTKFEANANKMTFVWMNNGSGSWTVWRASIDTVKKKNCLTASPSSRNFPLNIWQR